MRYWKPEDFSEAYDDASGPALYTRSDLHDDNF